ncbi:multiple resistance and pH regulation F family protein [Orientia chuto str. Dubai]|uniref:Multiple resistance and pH regulation F family protein n=1 Tax=Orientia chuto str. Dubai TaxID=1359168 RepID=A0A0F3MND7_9RICK|nr:multiple resistance and pH regulation F family protein [Orientia chuto str. Dubai]
MIPVIFILIGCIFVLIVKFLFTKSNLERILYINSLTNLISLFIVFIGMNYYTRYFIDISIIYLLLSFIATNAYMKLYLRN